MEDIEQLQARLDNIRSVEPILAALRTIAVGNWQLALRQQTRLSEYREHLLAVLPALTPHLLARCEQERRRQRHPLPDNPAREGRVAVLVVGSERGLCGGFNTALVKKTEDYLRTRQQENRRVELLALGARLARLMRRRRWELTWEGALSVTTLPPFSIARDLNRRWVADYEAERLDAVDLIYHTGDKPGVYTPTILRLFPPEAPTVAPTLPWPPPILETDPLGLYTRLLDQWTALHLYQILLESAAAEHATRLQLMEAATQNAGRLIVELTQLVQSARQQAITQEMQALAVGAGLLNS